MAAEVLGFRKRDRIDRVLDRESTSGSEPSDSMIERFGEVIDRGV
jgi:hypothetical protein